jgi:lysine 2,3-aminomutase
MEQRTKTRLLKILDTSPDLKEILISQDSLEEKRNKIRKVLSRKFMDLFEDNPDMPSLKWVVISDCLVVFRNLITKRSENLAGFSFLGYINNLIHMPEHKKTPKATPDFFAELDHLLKGIAGKAEVYPEKAPAFAKYQGVKAARLRSADLSRMGRRMKKYTDRYVSGLDDEAKRRRYQNKLRILNYFKATEMDWDDWHWQLRHTIREDKTLKGLIQLTDEESEAVRLASRYNIPFGITPYYLSLMDFKAGQGRDTAVRAQVIPSLHYVRSMLEQKKQDERSIDFMLERDTSPVEGITRRYPQIAILKPVLTCPQICVYCQRNWEIKDTHSRTAALPKAKLDKALQWISDTPELTEILITGGDPFLLSNDRIENMLFRLSKMPHIKRIRIGTRTPVTLPQRIKTSLVKTLDRYHIPGKREILIVTHFEHPYEITLNSLEAVQRFRRYGMEVYNQLVYTFYNSRKFEATFLRDKLRLIGVTPYYTFNTKGKEETNEFRVPIPRLLQEQKEEARLMPGTLRTDEIVFNVPGLGKNYLRAIQHHDVISMLPDGRRVYEFHPWEKKLSLADTYVYTDVSIYKYLGKLRAIGEEIADYKTIWYYF